MKFDHCAAAALTMVMQLKVLLGNAQALRNRRKASLEILELKSDRVMECLSVIGCRSQILRGRSAVGHQLC